MLAARPVNPDRALQAGPGKRVAVARRPRRAFAILVRNTAIEPIFLSHFRRPVTGRKIGATYRLRENAMKLTIRVMLAIALVVATGATHAKGETLKPFVLASSGDAGLAEKTREVVDALTSAGFEVVGQYSPLADTNVIVVTSEGLKSVAARSPRGGYAAGQRISVSRSNEMVEVGFVNPLYIQHAYRLDGDMRPVYDQLSAALGFERFCGGGDKKMTAEKLRKYNYMIGMQKFDDPSELGSFASYAAAVEAVESGLAKEGDGLTRIYRIDIPGKEQSVFGVGMKATSEAEENIDEAYQMKIVDFEGCMKRAYFPYEILVSGSQVEALHMRFRMAVHFPDLSMMGQHGFTKLMPFPGAIEEALEAAVNTD